MIGNLVGRREETNNEAVQQTHLDAHRTPPRLAFADHMNRFVAGDCAPGAPKRTEMLTRVDPLLDRAVVLFQNIV